MSNINFNPNLDKITEREVVYDFFDRLAIGKDTNIDEYNDTKILNQNDNVKSLLTKLLFNLPSEIISIITSIKSKSINISVYDINISFTLPKNSTICLIHSEKNNDNLTEIFEKNTEYNDNDSDEYIMNLDCPYINDDVIKIYYIVE